MKAGWIFFQIQLKKYAKMLPVILAESLLFAGIILAFGVYASGSVYGQKAVEQIRVGIVSGEDSRMMDMLLRFVGSMDSFKDSCHFERMEEQEAYAALSKGEIYGAVFLPERLVEGILDGTNPPARIVLPKSGSRMESAVFTEAAKAGARLLSAAQAGIYAADDFLRAEGRADRIEEAEAYLNEAYLSYALNRTAVFKLKEVSAWGKTGMFSYFGAALLLVFLTFAAMIMGRFSERCGTEFSRVISSFGLGTMKQYIGDTLAFSVIVTVLGGIIGFPVLLLCMRQEGMGSMNVAGLLLVLLTLAALGAFVRLLMEITGKEGGGMGAAFTVLLFMMTASGLLLPPAFLPVWLEKAGRVFPFRFFRQILLTAMLRGNAPWQAAVLILIITGCMLAGAAVFSFKSKRAGECTG